tara:strand:+ start:2380 stop:2514 length:135 start_codon:yes stop_codon:yes gene_type:complete
MSIYAFRRMREQNEAAKKTASTLLKKSKPKRKPREKKQEVKHGN